MTTSTIPKRLRAAGAEFSSPGLRALLHDAAERIKELERREETLTTALGAFVDQDIAYNDRDLVIRCSSHGEAMHKVFEARAVLAKVREQRDDDSHD